MRNLFIFAIGMIGACRGFAVDQAGVTKSLQATVSDDRFSLIGVIAEGDGKGKGIAVIKDSKLDKTYTLKIGDAVPGQIDFVLQKVSRQAAILHGPTADISVGFNATQSKDGSEGPGVDSNRPNLTRVDDDDDGDPSVEYGSTGLFEKWYQNRGPAVLNRVTEGKMDPTIDLPSPIRTHTRYRSSDDDMNSNGPITPRDDDADQPPTRVEYSEAMRALIDKYLNSNTPIP